MASLKLNVIANIGGRFWANAINILVIPFYVGALGKEAYGLVGVFGLLQAMMVILEGGLGTAAMRELARLSAHGESREAQRDCIRTTEIIFIAIGLLVCGLVALTSPLVAEYWLNADKLPAETLRWSLILMGGLLAVQLPTSLYFGGLMGLQRQVSANLAVAAIATLRAAAAVAVAIATGDVLWFFLVNVAVSLLQAMVVRVQLSWALAGPGRRGRFSMDSLRSIRGFATAMGLNSVIGILMTNMDKIVLSKLLPLETFAYYAIATSAAAGLWSIVIPYNAAVFPRLTQVWEQGAGTATADFRRLYHGVAQGASLLLLPTALTLITFAPVVLMVWQNDVDIVANAWLPMALLAAGNLLNGLSGPGHNLLLAAGRAGILTAVNGLMALALIPFMALAISWIGPMAGASLTWLLLNALYFVAVSPLAHRLLLPGTSLRWLLGDVAPPAVACAVVLVPSYLFIAMPTGRLTALLMVAVIGCATLLAAALATPVSRHRLLASLGLRAQG